MAFSNPAPPSATRYPNLLPVPGQLAPGRNLAKLARTDLQDYYRVIHEAEARYIAKFTMVAKPYYEALGVHKESDRETRLALYMLKPTQMWLDQRMYFPGPSKVFPNFADDFRDYTVLVEAWTKGELKGQDVAQAMAETGASPLQAFGQAQMDLAVAA